MTIAITSAFGDPLDPRTWSGAPANLAMALMRKGTTVEGIAPRMSLFEKAAIAAFDMVTGVGRPINTEHILRGRFSRSRLARRTEQAACQLGLRSVLHTGTFDLSVDRNPSLKHYLYCDHTWDLTRRYHRDVPKYNAQAMDEFERAEREALMGLSHIFTFGQYVRDNLIEHYGVLPHRVTAVGSGMGQIEPYYGSKDYSKNHLLFVAKHLWEAKGGELLLEAFDIARHQISDLKLTIVGGPDRPLYLYNVRVWDNMPWRALQSLYRDATLLVQPMYNDPWGQVYLEAMASRTVVMGLRRNGLPELTGNGVHGFMVDKPEPLALAKAIVAACANPKRLEKMADKAQGFAAQYTWAKTAEQIDEVIA